MRILLLIFSLFAFPSYAAAPIAFNVVLAESSIRFEIMQGTAKVTGSFPKFTAHIAFHPEALAASKAQVEVDMASVTVSEDQAKDMLPKPEWLDSKAFPKATFTSESFKALGDKRFEAAGKLTIKNVSIPVTLAFTLNEFSPSSASMRGELTLKRRDFHIGWDDTKSVADEVKVMIAVKAVAQ